ncbi:hypothetical protein KVR01_003378 [Diaporthe batatas]|uniref:uncharacterized protein n=1 Tax=Diaporthe batatas TaxID=748121 RepID=UPI001D04B380|nr:uncharacterized protein KVR01_003378 [Diaporthe batatas]KAG8167689.1 hypothetical protein KVR01_003378 [Diaporthe batatas]
MAGQRVSRRLRIATVLLSTLVVASGVSASQVDPKIPARELEVAELFSGIVSPETARAAAQDQVLRRHVEDAVELVADLSRMLAKRFEDVPELQQASLSLERYRNSLSDGTPATKERRQDILGGLGGLLGGGTGTAPATPGATDAAAGGGILSGITGSISSALSGIGDSLLQDVGGASMFLGIGLGAGAAQGLNLAQAPMTTQIAAKVAADNGMNATGLNPAIQNAAMGASASLLGAVNISSLAGSAGGSIDLNGVALGAANGIGNGISSGLKLSPQAMAMEPPPGNSTADIANTFTFALTKSLASNIDTTKLSANSINIQQFTGGVPTSQIAMSLAQGIGNGASSGLKLTQANLAPPTGNTASDALGAFGFGLTNSVTSNLNTSSLTSGNALQGININKIIPNLGMTAQSFGSGLGGGVAAGLKLNNAIVGMPDPNGNDAPAVAGNFAFGLTKSVTENINMTQLTSGNTALTGAASNIDIGRAAQGVAMGLVQGAGDAVNMMGGLQALINGTAMMPQQAAIPPSTLAFNDSLGGAAMGLGTGLGGQGTIVGVQLLSQLNVTSLVEGLVGNNTDSGMAPAAASAPVPSNGTGVARRSVRQVLSSAILPRQDSGVTAVSNGNSFNLSVVFNADTISSVTQRVISALSCEGVGGLVLVGLGLLDSGTISTNGVSTGINITTIQQVVPKGLIKFTSDGNKFEIDGQKVIDNLQGNLLSAADGISINGNTAVRFGVFLAVHIMVAMSVFLAILPLILTLEGTRVLLLRLKLGHVLPKATKWANIGWLWLMGPATLLLLIFGFLARGTAGHMQTAHGIIGLITAFVTFGATAFNVFSKLYISTKAPSPDASASVLPVPFALADRRTIGTLLSQLLLALSMPAVITGFSDLGAVTLCITRVVPFEFAFAIGMGLTTLYVTGSGISFLNILLATLDLRRAKKDAKDKVDEERWGKQTLKEKIQHVGPSRVQMGGRPETLRR